ncbi:TPA: hypothetical protein ACH3X1_003535 [Trebouxia sp. C0004]
MASLAKQAVGDNDPVSAEMYEKQANLYWLKHHAIVMEDPPHKRPILPAFPYPHRQPGPPLGIQRDPKLPAWGTPVSAQITAPQDQQPAQPQGQHSVQQTHVQPQPVQAQSAQAQHIGTAQVAQAVQPEAQILMANSADSSFTTGFFPNFPLCLPDAWLNQLKSGTGRTTYMYSLASLICCFQVGIKPDQQPHNVAAAWSQQLVEAFGRLAGLQAHQGSLMEVMLTLIRGETDTFRMINFPSLEGILEEQGPPVGQGSHVPGETPQAAEQPLFQLLTQVQQLVESNSATRSSLDELQRSLAQMQEALTGVVVMLAVEAICASDLCSSSSELLVDRWAMFLQDTL